MRKKKPSLSRKASSSLPTTTTATTTVVVVATNLFTRILVVAGTLMLLFDLYVLWPSLEKTKTTRIKGSASSGSDRSSSENANNHHHHSVHQVIRQQQSVSGKKRHNLQPQQPRPPSLEEGQGDEGSKARVLSVFRRAGILDALDGATIAELPTWAQVTEAYGDRPVIVPPDYSTTVCPEYRRAVPAVRRMLGAAGMFSTGTNLVTHLLKKNCQIPERVEKYGPRASKEDYGMRWQVPWGKHSPASYKYRHATEHAKDIVKDDLLPVVTIRNPWRWVQSMCKNPYTARWPHKHECPHLRSSAKNNQQRDDEQQQIHWNNVTVTFSDGKRKESYPSLIHLYNEWYDAYHSADYPLLMIRMEDLVYHTVDTITAVCECVGGRIVDPNNFTYVLDSAKADSPGHDTSTGLVRAWIKYSKPFAARAGFTPDDYDAMLEGLDQDLIMDQFHYHHPPAAGAIVR